MKGFVITVLAFALAVAFLARQPQGAGAPPMVTAGADAGKSGAPAAYGNAMALQREGDGHFYATVAVDGQDYRMLVDTGSSVVALTGDDAHAMGFDWDPSELAPVAHGASGPVMGVPVTISDMAVGDFEVHDVPALIVPDGLGESLLGQTFLQHVPKVEIADDTLTLSD